MWSSCEIRLCRVQSNCLNPLLYQEPYGILVCEIQGSDITHTSKEFLASTIWDGIESNPIPNKRGRLTQKYKSCIFNIDKYPKYHNTI